MSEKIERKKIVYAIYPNANGFGYVYLENARKLLDFGAVRVNPLTNRRILERIKRSFEYFRPSIVIVQDPDGNHARTGKRIRRLIEKIKKYCESENLKVFQYSRDTIREVFENFGAVSKYEISQVLINEFKELESRSPMKRKLWVGEDANMAIFDSLSLAVTWYWLNE